MINQPDFCDHLGRGTLSQMETTRRIAVRVRPGARRTFVGGEYAGPRGRALVVSVTERPTDGRATRAVAAAIAEAFGVPTRNVSLIAGQRSRDKIFEVSAPDIDERLDELLARPADGRPQ